ncbi:MAG TPA: LysR family transcriptional regulator substrate-binding protein [Pseudolysinimonas sp.]|nr:LysR family transcriptional regulator substrate-binding protein [Pseudolysinimonas sp.]
MAEPFVVLFVPGVTPGKWTRIWGERMPRQPLQVAPASGDTALAALRDGSAQMAFLRDAAADDEFHVIPLYREQPVVLAARDSAVAAFDALTLADLAGENVVTGEDAATAELIATGTAVAVMPQSVARALSRRDVVARPVTDAADSGIGLVWPTRAQHPLIETFIGIVRGRTANSSR